MCRTLAALAGSRWIHEVDRLLSRPMPMEVQRMADEDLEKYETNVELQIYKEYRDVLPMFRYVIETERRFYLANDVDMQTRARDGSVYFELELGDAWVWDMYRPARFVKNVKVMTFRDVNIEETLSQSVQVGDILPPTAD